MLLDPSTLLVYTSPVVAPAATRRGNRLKEALPRRMALFLRLWRALSGSRPLLAGSSFRFSTLTTFRRPFPGGLKMEFDP
jgi:hypothetical protein